MQYLNKFYSTFNYPLGLIYNYATHNYPSEKDSFPVERDAFTPPEVIQMWEKRKESQSTTLEEVGTVLRIFTLVNKLGLFEPGSTLLSTTIAKALPYSTLIPSLFFRGRISQNRVMDHVVFVLGHSVLSKAVEFSLPKEWKFWLDLAVLISSCGIQGYRLGCEIKELSNSARGIKQKSFKIMNLVLDTAILVVNGRDVYSKMLELKEKEKKMVELVSNEIKDQLNKDWGEISAFQYFDREINDSPYHTELGFVDTASEICQKLDEHQQSKIDHLMFLFHGSSDKMRLGKEYLLSNNITQVSNCIIRNLNPEGEIFLKSCSTGGELEDSLNFAQTLADSTNHIVHAPTRDVRAKECKLGLDSNLKPAFSCYRIDFGEAIVKFFPKSWK